MSLGIRTLAGFAISPLVPGAIIALLALRTEPELSLWYFKLGAALGFASAVPFGIPLHWLMAKNNWTSLTCYLLLGLVLGAVSFLIAIVPPLIAAPQAIQSLGFWAMAYLMICSLLGCLSGLAFWLTPHLAGDRNAHESIFCDGGMEVKSNE